MLLINMAQNHSNHTSAPQQRSLIHHQQWPSLSAAQSELNQETAHVLTTVHDAEMTTHQLSDNIWLNVVKDDYSAAEEAKIFNNQNLFSSNLSDG